ncbi:TRAP transporter small permease [Azorhizobium doebereinerae]|uniref:TRAP transporter small permease n=1 Tax=Azorhizobium doebereinerae TaxID=281091 RepID=UPI000685E2DB|nr:TRAP transporter small permease [Azorhizobium doebereinerae]
MVVKIRADGLGTALAHLLDHLEETLISVLIASATLLIFVAVMQRYASGIRVLYPYVHGFDLGWAQEACILMFVWMAKIGAAYGVRTGIHVGVDVLVNRLKDRPRKALILFGLMCGALFTAVVGTFGLKFVMARYGFGDTTPEMEMPSWIAYLAIPIGSYLMCFRFLQVAFWFWRTGELPSHDHGHVDGLDDPPGITDSDLFPKEVRR